MIAHWQSSMCYIDSVCTSYSRQMFLSVAVSTSSTKAGHGDDWIKFSFNSWAAVAFRRSAHRKVCTWWKAATTSAGFCHQVCIVFLCDWIRLLEALFISVLCVLIIVIIIIIIIIIFELLCYHVLPSSRFAVFAIWVFIWIQTSPWEFMSRRRSPVVSPHCDRSEVFNAQ